MAFHRGGAVSHYWLHVCRRSHFLTRLVSELQSGNFWERKNGFSKIRAGRRDKTEFLHTSASLSDKNLERLRRTPKDGGDRSSWQNDEKLQIPCYASGEKKFYDTYGRMWWDRPAPTITTKFFSISCGRFAHPEEDRAISLREGAILQTFPKDYRFVSDNIGSVAKMIGNCCASSVRRNNR